MKPTLSSFSFFLFDTRFLAMCRRSVRRNREEGDKLGFMAGWVRDVAIWRKFRRDSFARCVGGGL